jgi:hypothetical protein
VREAANPYQLTPPHTGLDRPTAALVFSVLKLKTDFIFIKELLDA